MPNDYCLSHRRGGGRCRKWAKNGSSYCNNHQIPLVARTCGPCGTRFMPAKPTSTTCSTRCRNARTAQRSAAARGEAQRGRGEGRSYRKLMGRHEHRAVAEQMLGRPLTSDEVVHHRNRDILDNRPKNIEVMLRSEHTRMHALEYHARKNRPGGQEQRS